MWKATLYYFSTLSISVGGLHMVYSIDLQAGGAILTIVLAAALLLFPILVTNLRRESQRHLRRVFEAELASRRAGRRSAHAHTQASDEAQSDRPAIPQVSG
jgi:predicted LPLAT superfamily acyltransferase